MFRDAMQSAGLASFAEIGIILFVIAFTLIFINAMFGLKPEAIDELTQLPLNQNDAPDPALEPHTPLEQESQHA